MKKIGVVLSGCGTYDGSEIHEVVLTLLAIAQSGATAVCFAPNEIQHDVIDHITQTPTRDIRNVLVESARLTRGKIIPLSEADESLLDGVIVPGGLGALKNLSTFAEQGVDCTIHTDFSQLVVACHQAGKPLGFMGLTPMMLPKVIDAPLRLTIGTDIDQAELLESMGAFHVPCPVDDIVVDELHKVITTPAYMLAEHIDEAAVGIGKLVNHMLRLME